MGYGFYLLTPVGHACICYICICVCIYMFDIYVYCYYAFSVRCHLLLKLILSIPIHFTIVVRNCFCHTFESLHTLSLFFFLQIYMENFQVFSFSSSPIYWIVLIQTYKCCCIFHVQLSLGHWEK